MQAYQCEITEAFFHAAAPSDGPFFVRENPLDDVWRAQSDSGLSKFLTWLREEEARLHTEESQGRRAVSRQV